MKPWKRIAPTTVQKVGRRTVVVKTFVYPDNTIGTYDTKEREGWAGVATIALTVNNEVIIVRQFRPGPECIMDELPGGGVEEGEEASLEQAARRELHEETGYNAGAMSYLGKLSYDAHTNGWRHYFLARDCRLSRKKQNLDVTERHENLEVHTISVPALLENAKQGRMTDPGAVLLAYDVTENKRREIMSNVRKAVIAAAGFGTRFLPQTKAMPKEMLPLVDKPIIQYIVEQLVDAGIKDIIVVTGYSKRSIEDHFDTPNEDLLNNLRVGGPKKTRYIDEVEAIADMANFAYVRQKGPYGTATPVMNAAHLVGNEPFIYTYADDFFLAKPNAFSQIIEQYNQLGGGILPCIKVETDKEFGRYGILGGEQLNGDVLKMTSIIEKPGRDKAPSNFASVGGVLLTPDVFDYLEQGRARLQPGQEFYLTDHIIQPMLADGKHFYGYAIQNGTRYDTGDKLEYLKTVVDFALRRQDIGEAFREYLKQCVKA